MDSFSSYHINKGGNIHSFKIESHRTTCLQNSSRKMTEREDTTWSSSSSICILITCRWILGKRVISEVISRPFLVELFVAIAVFAFYQFWLPITFSGVCWFFFCSCLIEASEVRCTLFSPFSFSVFLSHLRALCLPGIGEIACVPTASAAPQQVQAMCHHQKYSQAAPVSNSPASTASPIPSGAYTSPLALQLSWGQHEGMMIFISAIQTVRRQGVGRSLSWQRQVKARKVSRQQSQSIMFCEVSGTVSEHP